MKDLKVIEDVREVEPESSGIEILKQNIGKAYDNAENLSTWSRKNNYRFT